MAAFGEIFMAIGKVARYLRNQHFISYALFRELDMLGISSVHNGPATESINYG